MSLRQRTFFDDEFESDQAQKRCGQLQLGEKLKREGMEAAADARATALERARAEAIEICRRNGTVCADDLQHWKLGPAAGSLFCRSVFEWTGKMRKSSQPLNHARLLYVWRLKSERK